MRRVPQAGRGIGRRPARALWTLLAVGLAGGAQAAVPDPFPASPHAIVDGRLPLPVLVDAAPACLPGAGIAALASLREQVREGDAEAAARQLATIAPGAGPESAAALRAVARARSVAPSQLASVRRALDRALREDGSAPDRVCLHLERARLDLRSGLAPEALVSVLRAEREQALDRLPERRRETARFYRAEALVGMGRSEEAEAFYVGLQESTEPALAVAARLRLLWIRADRNEPPAVYKALAALIEEGSGEDLDLRAWSLLVAEPAIAAGRFEDAHRWLARAEEIEGRSSLAAIRRADVLAALGRRDDARQALERVAGGGAAGARALAATRLSALALVDEDEGARDARLASVAATASPRVATHARAWLAHRRVLDGDWAAALEPLTRLAYEETDPFVAPFFRDDLDATLRGIATSGGENACVHVVERLGGRRTVLLRHARELEPFLRLGDCYLMLGLPRAALGTWREASKAFGPDLPASLPLRLARASLAAGERAAVRAAVRASLAHLAAPAERAPWELLAAELAVGEGRADEAAGPLMRLVDGPHLAPDERDRAVRALAEVALHADLAPEHATAVRDTLWAASRSEAPLSDVTRARAALAAADALRLAGERDAARALYGTAGHRLPGEDARRERALYEEGRQAPDLESAVETWGSLSAGDESSGWRRLARAELRLARLRRAVGLGRRPTP